MPKCGRCDGTGRGYTGEDDYRGVPIYDACYHCGNTGIITEAQRLADDFRAIVYVAACFLIDDCIRATNNNPDGEGWAFAAAENGLQSYEYTQMRIDEEAHYLMDRCHVMDDEELAEMVDKGQWRNVRFIVEEPRDRLALAAAIIQYTK